MFALETSFRERHSETKNNTGVGDYDYRARPFSLSPEGRTCANERNWEEYGIELSRNRMGCLPTDKGEDIQIVAV